MPRLILLAALAASLAAQAAGLPYGRLFYNAEERAVLEDARRRNIRAEELAAEAAKQVKQAKQARAPRPRKVTVTGIVQRSDGASVAWINGTAVESETSDGLRVRHGAGQTSVVVYDPDKRRAVSVKVGQQADLTTGRIEESYKARRRSARAAEQPALDAEPGTSAPPLPREPAARAPGNPAPPEGKGDAPKDESGSNGGKNGRDADSEPDAAIEAERNAEGDEQGG